MTPSGYEIDKPILRATLRMYAAGWIKERQSIRRHLVAYMRKQGWPEADIKAYLQMASRAIQEVVTNT